MTTLESFDNYAKEIGGLLKTAREKAAVDLSEAAQKIALSATQLRYLEGGEQGLFYNERYYLQAARRYAEFLNIELPEFKHDTTATKPAETPPTREAHHQVPLKHSGGRPWLITAGAFAVIAIGIFSMIETQEAPATVTVATAKEASVETSSPVATNISVPVNPQIATNAAAPVDSPLPASTSTPNTATTNPVPSGTTAVPAKDGVLVNTSATWVQIVSRNGDKRDLRPKAGERIEFDAQSTAAIVFGRPSTATLTVKGSTVDLERFTVKEASTPRALVIIRDL